MPIHESLIQGRSFAEKFKNSLRDFYSYGFKDRGYYGQEWKAVNRPVKENWDRLNGLLGGYMDWPDWSEGVLAATVDSLTLEGNPFHRVYRY